MSRLTTAALTVTATAALIAVAASPASAVSLLPDLQANGHPINRYEIWYDPGGFADVTPKVLGLFIELAFGACRIVVSVATWLITWAYSFGFADALAGPAARLAGAYQTRLVGPLELRHLALFAAVVYAGVHGLRGRLAHGAGELAVSLAVMAASGLILASPEALFRSGVRFTAGLSQAVLELANEPSAHSAPGTAARTHPLTEGLLDAFLVQPHDILNWGQTLAGPCAAQRDEALATGPHGTADTPRELMRDGGPSCESFADFNAVASTERLMGAMLVLLAALLVLACMSLIAATVCVAQLVAVALIGWTPFALAAGILPGAGRQLLWRWAAAAARCAVTVLAMAGLLTFVLVTSQTLLADARQTLLERFALLVMTAAAALVMRRRVLATSRRMTARLSRRLESARVGGSHGAAWLGPAAAGGITGFGLAHLASEARQEVRGFTHSPLAWGLASNLAHRRSARRPTTGHTEGEAAASSSRTAAAARMAADLTVNLPRSAPRAIARGVLAAEHGAEHTRQRLAQARTVAEEWRDGVAHPVQSYRRERSRIIAEQGAVRRAAAAHAQLRALSTRGPLEEET